MDIFNKPIFFGLIAAIISYYFFRNDKDEEINNMSLKYSLLIGILVWITGYYFQGSNIQIMPPYNIPTQMNSNLSVFTDKPNWNI